MFWVYLWQLKNYHLGRFKAHFSTEKGKKLLLNKLLLSKTILLLGFLFSSIIIFFMPFLSNAIFLPLLLFILYFFLSIKFFKDFLRKKIKKPVLTNKTQIILFSCFIVFSAIPVFLWNYIQQDTTTFDKPPLLKFYFLLLLIDVLAPIIISLIVSAFQPITILLRNRIIKKAKIKREKHKNLLVIGITGSYGKTASKEFLYTILSEKFGSNKVLKTTEHQNSEIGISQCILNDLKPEHEIFICEMGAYNKGGIKLLSDIAKPKIGVLTGINQQHLATFGSQENIIKTKFELIESLPKDGVAFFNKKNKYCLELFEKTKIKKKFYGEGSDSIDSENIAGAVEVARELGVKEQEIVKAKEKIKPWPQIKKGVNGLNIIDATYSANPDSVIAHLDYLKCAYPDAKKIIVMPCLIELGNASKEVHQKIGESISRICDLAIITTKECFEDVKKGFDKNHNTEKCEIIFEPNAGRIVEKVKSAFASAEVTADKTGDIVLLESRVPKQIVENLSKIR